MDLNIVIDPYTDQENEIKRVLDKAVEFGYETVCLNTVVDCSKLFEKNICIPEPKLINYEAGANYFKVFSRVTGIVEEGEHYQKFVKYPATKKYDIIAIQPVGEKMCHFVCSRTDCDIISLNLAETLGFNLKRTTVGQAINRGICFEITYRPMLKDQTSRQMLISNSQSLVDILKGRNILISSGAVGALELRSVNDAINLGLLFGFDKNKAESAVRNVGKLVQKHAENRNKTGCGYVSLSGIFTVAKQQGWIVHACKVPKPSEIGSTPKKRRVDD